MTLVVDAGVAVAMHDRRDPRQAAAETVLREEPGELVVPAAVAAEIDFLLGRRGGRATRLLFLEDVAAGRYRVECLDAGEYATVLQLERRYAVLDAGLTWIDVKPEVEAAYNDRLQEDMARVGPWTEGNCHNYYWGPGGRIVTQWPHSMSEYRRRTEADDLDAYESG